MLQTSYMYAPHQAASPVQQNCGVPAGVMAAAYNPANAAAAAAAAGLQQQFQVNGTPTSLAL